MSSNVPSWSPSTNISAGEVKQLRELAKKPQEFSFGSTKPPKVELITLSNGREALRVTAGFKTPDPFMPTMTESYLIDPTDGSVHHTFRSIPKEERKPGQSSIAEPDLNAPSDTEWGQPLKLSVQPIVNQLVNGEIPANPAKKWPIVVP